MLAIFSKLWVPKQNYHYLFQASYRMPEVFFCKTSNFEAFANFSLKISCYTVAHTQTPLAVQWLTPTQSHTCTCFPHTPIPTSPTCMHKHNTHTPHIHRHTHTTQRERHTHLYHYCQNQVHGPHFGNEPGDNRSSDRMGSRNTSIIPGARFPCCSRGTESHMVHIFH